MYILQVKCSICDAIYIGKTHHPCKKSMYIHFYDILCLVENVQKSDSFAFHVELNISTTTSCTDIRKDMTLKVVNKLNLIGTMKTFMKPNCNLCMQER